MSYSSPGGINYKVKTYTITAADLTGAVPFTLVGMHWFYYFMICDQFLYNGGAYLQFQNTDGSWSLFASVGAPNQEQSGDSSPVGGGSSAQSYALWPMTVRLFIPAECTIGSVQIIINYY